MFYVVFFHFHCRILHHLIFLLSFFLSFFLSSFLPFFLPCFSFDNREDFELALKSLGRALEIAPTHRNAKRYLETTLLRRGAKREGRGLLAEAMGDFEDARRLQGEQLAEAEAAIKRVQMSMDRRALATASKNASARAAFGGGFSAAPGARASAAGTPAKTADSANAAALRALLAAEADGKHHKSKHKKHKKHKRRGSDDSDSEGEHKRHKKKHKSK